MKGGFLWNLRCIAGIRRWQEVLRRLSWCLKMGVCSALVQENFIDGNVAVADGIVIGVGTYEGETEIDLEGKVICPGFIDSHLHLESTLVRRGSWSGRLHSVELQHLL